MPQKIGYLFKNMVLNILANSLLHAVLGEAEKQKVEKKKKKHCLCASKLVWAEKENLAFKRTVPFHLQLLLQMHHVYEDITCVTAQKENQKFSTSKNELPKVHRCFILLLKLFVIFVF